MVNTSCRYCVFDDGNGVLTRASVHDFRYDVARNITLALVSRVHDQVPKYGPPEWVDVDTIHVMAPNKAEIDKAWNHLLHTEAAGNP